MVDHKTIYSIINMKTKDMLISMKSLPIIFGDELATEFGAGKRFKLKLKKEIIDKFLHELQNDLAGGYEASDKLTSLYKYEWYDDSGVVEKNQCLLITIPNTNKEWEFFYKNDYSITIAFYEKLNI